MGNEARKYAYGGKVEEAIRLEAQAKAFEGVIEKELEISGLKSNMMVLDAGCGTGSVTRKIALKAHPEEAYGVDFDPLFIKEATKLAANQGIQNMKFELGNIDNLKFDDAMFDLSYCRLVLMHVSNPVKTITELKRVTKIGGLVVAADTDDGSMLTYPHAPKFFDLWLKFCQRAKARGDARYISRPLFSIFSDAGLSSIKIYPFPLFATQQTPEMLKTLVSAPIQIVEQDKDAVIQEGLITAEDYKEALQEAQCVLKHPSAFATGLTFLAVGKVP